MGTFTALCCRMWRGKKADAAAAFTAELACEEAWADKRQHSQLNLHVREPGLTREMRIVDYSGVDGRYDKRAFPSTAPNFEQGCEESQDRSRLVSDTGRQDLRSV